MKNLIVKLMLLAAACAMLLATAIADDKPAEFQGDFYKRFEGRIDGDHDFVMHLVRNGDRIFGYYCYEKYGQTLFLNGTIDAAGNFFLAEFPRSDGTLDEAVSTGSFAGYFKKPDAIEGEWRSADEKKKFAFQAGETYGAGALPLSFYHLEERETLDSGDRSSSADVAYNLICPDPKDRRPAAAKIRAALLSRNPENPLLELEARRDEFFDDFRGLADDEIGGAGWYQMIDMGVVLNDRGLLTLFAFQNEYSGGAHGGASTTYRTFALADGRLLALEDVFTPAGGKKIIALIDAELRRRDGLKANDRLSEHGYFSDEIPLAENWYVAIDGIGFFYNEYEIRPYAYGPSAVFLGWDRFKQFIRPDSPVRGLLPK